MPAIPRTRSARLIVELSSTVLATLALGADAAPAPPREEESDHHRTAADAGVIVDRLVDDRLASLAEEIARLESSRSREPLLARRFTVETFLIAATLPLGLLGGDELPVDPCPLWRNDFRGPVPPLLAVVPESRSAEHRGGLGGGAGASARPRDPSAFSGEFLVELRHAVDGDDPVAVGGLIAVGAAADGSRSLAILATRCEPCLSPGSVDFPIVPECFLLESDQHETLIAVLEPEPLSHREARRPEPPRLDQPEDLYDLLDGVRPLALGVPPDAPPPPPEIAHDLAPSDVAWSTPPPTGAAALPPTSTWESRDQSGRLLQRVTLQRAVDGIVELRVEQPPVEVEWTSGELYQLDGHRPDGSLDRRWLRPRGTAIAHPVGLDAIFRLETSSRRSTIAIDGEVTRRGEVLASIRWRNLRAIDLDELAAIRASWHAIVAPAIARPAGAERGPDEARGMTPRLADGSPARGLDHRALEREAARRALRVALGSGDADALREATLRHRRAIESDGVAPAMTLRSLEGLAESLAGVGDASALAGLLGAPWSEAVAVIPTPDLARLVRERVTQGRWASASLLASSLAARTDLPVAEREALDALSSRLARLIGDESSARPRPTWFEPPGRRALEEFVQAGSSRSAPSANSAPGADRPAVAAAPTERTP